MSVLTNWFLGLFRLRVSANRPATHARKLTFEPLGRRLLLAGDVVPQYGGEVVQEVEQQYVDEAMVGGAEIESNPRAEGGVSVSVSVAVEGLKVGPGRIGGGKSSGLDTIETASASYGGYGGYGPELNVTSVEFLDGEYIVSGVVEDDDLTDATVTIDGVTVDMNAVLTGHFTVEISGGYYEFVDIIVEDKDGNKVESTEEVD